MECSKSNVRRSRETICEMFFKPALAVCSVWLSSINTLCLAKTFLLSVLQLTEPKRILSVYKTEGRASCKMAFGHASFFWMHFNGRILSALSRNFRPTAQESKNHTLITFLLTMFSNTFLSLLQEQKRQKLNLTYLAFTPQQQMCIQKSCMLLITTISGGTSSHRSQFQSHRWKRMK